MNRKHKGMMFDENGNVVCEPNAEFGADVEVDGKFKINSAKDLVTKDGTSIGGEDIPTLVVTRNASDDELYFTQESLAIIKKRMQTKTPIGKYSLEFTKGVFLDCIAYEMVHVPKVEGISEESVVFPLFFNLAGINIYSVNIVNLITGKITTSTLNNYTGFVVNDTNVILADDTSANYRRTMYINTINGKPIVSGTESKDIKLQSPLYRHTITILKTTTGDKHLLIMTHQSEDNLKIDSIQDLITVFKGTSLSCICTHETTIHISDTVDDIYINDVTHSRINVGNTLAEITLDTASDLEQEPFTDVFDTTGFTITDSVTAM